MKRFAVTFVGLLIQMSSVYAQTDSTSTKADKNENHSFVPAPYLNYSRSVGLGVGFIPIYMFHVNKEDTLSPESIVGALGVYTTNQTYFAMGFGRLYLKEDKWRLGFASGIGDLNYQVFIDQPLYQYIDYNTNMFFGHVQLQRKTFKQLYAGLVFQYMEFITLFGDQSEFPLENTLIGTGVSLDWDDRDNVYYPSMGSLIDLSWNSYPGFLGNEKTSNRITTSYNLFKKRSNSNDVWAFRYYGEFGLGDLAFNQQVVVGRVDLRGYTQGDYRGDGVLDLQSEYRLNFENKMGMVFFGGVGTIYGAINNGYNWIVLPSLGTGFRYTVFPKNQMNLGLDAAVGRGDWGIYFRVGESF